MEKEPQSEPQQALTLELLEMGFAADLIPEALAVSKTKQQAVNYLLGNKPESQPIKIAENIKPEEEQFQDEQEEDYKMIFVVRNDLKLALHKIAELTATGALRAYRQIEALVQTDELKEMAFYQWNEGGQKKIVVKAPNEKELLDLADKAKKANINFVLVEQLETNLKFQKQPQPVSKKQAKALAKNQNFAKQENKEQKKQQIKQQDPQSTKQQVKAATDPEKPVSSMVKDTLSKQQQKIVVLGAFGPAAESDLDPLTKHFKLL